MEDPRFPIGKWQRRDVLTPAERSAAVDAIAATPARLREAVAGLSGAQLDTPYRDGGWTLRQVVHHLPDSHLNSYCRYKLALTEERPLVRGYDEARWAELNDARDTPVEVSLALLESLHARWVTILRGMTEADFARVLQHPDNGEMTLDMMTSLYAWHGAHHVAHVTSTRERLGL